MLYLLSPDQNVLSVSPNVNHPDLPHLTKCLSVYVLPLYSMVVLSYGALKTNSVANDAHVSTKYTNF